MEEDRPSVAGTSPPLKLMLNLYSTSDSTSLTMWTVLEMTSSVSLTSYTLLSNWKETAEQGEQREGTGRETSVIYSYRKKQDRQRGVLRCRSRDKLAGWLTAIGSNSPFEYCSSPIRSEGYGTWFVCLSPLILALQAPNRLMSNTNGSSATSARKLMWRFR